MEVTQKWVEHGDIMKTIQEFLASLGLNLFIPSTREILPCAEVMMAPQLRNYQEAAQAMGDAKTHGEACRFVCICWSKLSGAYEYFK